MLKKFIITSSRADFELTQDLIAYFKDKKFLSSI